MINKVVTWFGNLFLACVLVMIAVQTPGLAQETEAPEEVVEPVNTDPNRKSSITLSGTGVIQTVGGLTITPTQFDTGLLDIGESSQHQIVITHIGEDDADPIVINEASLFGGSVDDFTSDFAGFITLSPGDSATVNLSYAPQSPGVKSAGFKVNVQGATAPHVVLIAGMARYPLTSDLIPAEDTVQFGQVVINGTGKKTLVLTNTALESDAPVINLFNVALTGDTPQDFNVDFTPTTLAPGQSTSIDIELQSSQEGQKQSKLTIEHDGYNGDVEVTLKGEVVAPQNIPVNFSASNLKNVSITRGTSLAFGPDGKLYVAQMDGKIFAYNVTRSGKNNYTANKTDTITSVHNVKNHNDNGSVNNSLGERLVTGILLTGTASNPVIYTQSSDPRQGGGPSGNDTNLDTNSGILHKLTKNGNNWSKVDLVRGLPRSEENHHGNGMVLMGNKLLMASGGHTNMGVPSHNFADLPEFALSAAILEFDLNALGNGTYDLPTLDDEDRSGVNDNNDPFGGNNGKNQAILENNGPIEIYAPGFRNAYDLVLTESGKLYTIDNGPNAGWGGKPPGNCSDGIDNGGSTYKDGLHYIKNKGYYGGHPNPTRGSKGNKFNSSNPQSPIEGSANSEECDFKIPKNQDGALTLFDKSTNGLDEYTASNFGGAMKGDLVAAGFGKFVFRLSLNNAGTAVTSKEELATGIGSVPLDIVALGDNDPFPGTIWVVDNQSSKITVLEPEDY
ncbi:MAG: choice-of-anchor D domain-containing protein [Granulosicoccus sp.]|nr:choice-of-anchor D domain-containing protein [Granulosicoccus sp.]